jgi:diacylglycerol kinase family enzyme
MARTAIVLVNARAGSVQREQDRDRIAAALAAAGVEAEIRAVAGGALAEEARRAAGAAPDAVIAAGGDGTVAAVAGALAGGRVPLGILPLGTFNHFARDLGLPLDLAEAARVVAAGRVRSVDVAEVNGRVFVNNSSIGLYPLAVRARRRGSRRLPRVLRMAFALARLVIRLPRLPLRLTVASASVPRRTPIVFVGNNPYEMRLLAPQRRRALDGGALGVLVVRRASRLHLVALALRALVGRLDAGRDLDALRVDALRVDSRRRRLHVAADGEVLRLAPPIEYRIRPAALPVLAPGPAA